MNMNGASVCKRIEEADLFTKRFGSFSKTDYEVLMFTVYLDSLPKDKTVFDYQISQELGITETKVRSLRIKSQLLYPKKIDWEGALALGIQHGRYSTVDNMITITIEDPSCLNRIRYEIESAYGTLDLTNYQKQLKLPIESVIALALKIDSESEKDILERLNSEWKKQDKYNQRITRESLGKRIFKGCRSVVDILSETIALWTGASSIMTSLVDLVMGV